MFRSDNGAGKNSRIFFCGQPSKFGAQTTARMASGHDDQNAPQIQGALIARLGPILTYDRNGDRQAGPVPTMKVPVDCHNCSG